MEIGQEVKLINTLPAAWFHGEVPTHISGKVTKVYANGKFGVAVHSHSLCGKRGKVMHFTKEDLV